MTIHAIKFTPEVLLSAPRYSAGVPDPSGFKILNSSSTYSFAEHSKKSEIRVLDVRTQETTLVTDDGGVSEPHWLDEGSIIVLKEESDGSTALKVGKIDDWANR